METGYQVLWGIFFMCTGAAMLLMSNWTLRISVFVTAFIVLFFFLSWTFITACNPEYVDDALGYTLIGLSFLIAVPGALAAQRMSLNYLAPLFAGLAFFSTASLFASYLDFKENEYLTTGMQGISFTFGLYLGQRLSNQIRVFLMCAIGSLIITFGGYLALGLLPIDKTFYGNQVIYYLCVAALTILTTILQRGEMTNVQTVFIFDPRKAAQENEKRIKMLEKHNLEADAVDFRLSLIKGERSPTADGSFGDAGRSTQASRINVSKSLRRKKNSYLNMEASENRSQNSDLGMSKDTFRGGTVHSPGVRSGADKVAWSRESSFDLGKHVEDVKLRREASTDYAGAGTTPNTTSKAKKPSLLAFFSSE
jgi:hypothetical protein